MKQAAYSEDNVRSMTKEFQSHNPDIKVNLTFVALSRVYGLAGQVFVVFVMTVAAAEAAIGLAILVIFFRRRGSIAVDDVNRMRG